MDGGSVKNTPRLKYPYTLHHSAVPYNNRFNATPTHWSSELISTSLFTDMLYLYHQSIKSYWQKSSKPPPLKPPSHRSDSPSKTQHHRPFTLFLIVLKKDPPPNSSSSSYTSAQKPQQQLSTRKQPQSRQPHPQSPWDKASAPPQSQTSSSWPRSKCCLSIYSLLRRGRRRRARGRSVWEG